MTASPSATERNRNPYRRAILLASLIWLGAMPLLPAPPGRLASLATHGWLLLLVVVTLGGAAALRAWDAIHVPLIAVLYLGAYCLPVIGVWPLPLIVVLAGYGAVLAGSSGVRRTVRYWRRGTIDRTTVLWMALFTLASAIALVAWRYGAHADLARYRRFVPSGLPSWMLFAGVVPYAMFNAFFEELLCRGVIWQACEEAYGVLGALVLTSLLFGLWHYRGFPSGMLGVALATGYGLMMGFVRIRTKGLWGPWAAHVLADVVIYVLVVAMVVFGV
jgi:membrane protease YdiL (CAAX protease family)